MKANIWLTALKAARDEVARLNVEAEGNMVERTTLYEFFLVNNPRSSRSWQCIHKNLRERVCVERVGCFRGHEWGGSDKSASTLGRILASMGEASTFGSRSEFERFKPRRLLNSNN